MDRAEKVLREILKEHGTFVRKGRHEVYRLPNGHSVSIRSPGRRGNQDHWKSALSYVRRTMRLPAKTDESQKKEAS